MYEFHYIYIKNKYGNYSRLLLAESLMYVIKAEDIYEDFSKDKEMLDFSSYSDKSGFMMIQTISCW